MNETEQKEALDELRATYAYYHGVVNYLNARRISRDLGVSNTTISNYLAGKHGTRPYTSKTGSNSQHLTDLAAWWLLHREKIFAHSDISLDNAKGPPLDAD